MGIWIRTQDKEMIINCYAIGINFEDDNSIYSSGYVLGKYSTKEKALKVLDEIQEFIVYYENISNMVYQMPQDDEVK